MKTKEIKIERGSGNVFADLGRPDVEAQLLKADLVTRIDKVIRQRGLKQVEAGKLLGLSQPDVSRLLRGDFREYSVERLLRLLTMLGHDVEIVIRESRSHRPGRLNVQTDQGRAPDRPVNRQRAAQAATLVNEKAEDPDYPEVDNRPGSSTAAPPIPG